MSTTHSENSLKNWALLVILTLIWGTSFILIKRGLEVFTPGEVGAYRMVAAASLLLPLSLPKLKNLSMTQVKNLLLAGLLGSFIPAFLFPMAQTQTHRQHSSPQSDCSASNTPADFSCSTANSRESC